MRRDPTSPVHFVGTTDQCITYVRTQCGSVNRCACICTYVCESDVQMRDAGLTAPYVHTYVVQPRIRISTLRCSASSSSTKWK